jgi:antitoxin component YwqK of YwqJK toxin-antitoxin module
MKKHIIISLLFLSIGLSQQEYNSNDLIEMDNGLWTEKFSDEPITGKVYGGFGEESNLKKVYIGNLLNGKKEGKWTFWYHETGTKQIEENFKDGKKEGLETCWYRTGEKFWEINNKDDKRHGLWIEWYKNGQKQKEKTFKNGKRIGIETDWYENGQKKKEDNFNEKGQPYSKWTRWYENGQKKSETRWKKFPLFENNQKKDEGVYKKINENLSPSIHESIDWYKNGQKKRETIYDYKSMGSDSFISEKCWDEDGNECECSIDIGEGCK